MPGAVVLLAAVLAAAPVAPAGAGIARVRVELQPAPGVLFNQKGPTRLSLQGPFGPAVERGLSRGSAYAPDFEVYDTAVPAVEFALATPAGVAAGEYPLHLTGTLFLCDEAKHVCFRKKVAAEGTLRVDAGGVAAPVVLTVRAER